MRLLAIPALVLAALVAATPARSAERPRISTRRGAVYVDGEPAWRGRRLTSALVWSQRGDAVAFTARDRAGRGTLVALIFADGAAPAAISWPIPRAAEPAHVVTWLGPTRLGAGPSVLEPKVVASFTMLRSTP
jgi:hypothetical protein